MRTLRADEWIETQESMPAINARDGIQIDTAPIPFMLQELMVQRFRLGSESRGQVGLRYAEAWELNASAGRCGFRSATQ
jgi:hypothetical protein